VTGAYAIQRLRFRGSDMIGAAIFLAYLVPPSILFIRWPPWSSTSGCSVPSGH
jgi:ABC-type glycerol-3-phosphate transport system permease component